MPSLQRGSVFKLDGGQWAYRLARDEHGRRRQVGGFRTKGEARAASDRHLERIRTGVCEQRELTLGGSSTSTWLSTSPRTTRSRP
jgi:hypothetical protein